MYSTGVIITLLIGDLIAAVASSDDDILCYLQKIESWKTITYMDPNSIGSTPIKTITRFNGPFNLYFTNDGTAYLIDHGHTKFTLSIARVTN